VKGGIPRPIEAVIAFTALMLLSPVLAAVAVTVAVSSGQAVLFRQTRVGRGAQPFVLYKFRSMRACAAGVGVTAADDPRITEVGRVLRMTKLDELPQLWNVLKGDMSLVGPRPEALQYVDVSDSRWREVLQVRPGLTDPVTLALRNEQTLLAEIGLDREGFYLTSLVPWKLHGYVIYLRRRNWWSDLVVLGRTAAAIVVPSSIPMPSLDDITASVDGKQ
jgi:lipopolysaccharide/colanic/teichoic acid biosynthesis glycosyltransferase